MINTIAEAVALAGLPSWMTAWFLGLGYVLAIVVAYAMYQAWRQRKLDRSNARMRPVKSLLHTPVPMPADQGETLTGCARRFEHGTPTITIVTADSPKVSERPLLPPAGTDIRPPSQGGMPPTNLNWEQPGSRDGVDMFRDTP